MDGEDEYEKAVLDLLARQQKDDIDLINEQNQKWGALQIEKGQAVDHFGHNLYTSRTYRQKEAELIAEFNDRREQQKIDHERALADLADEANKKYVAEKLKEAAQEQTEQEVAAEEQAAIAEWHYEQERAYHQEQYVPDVDVEPKQEQDQSYSDLTRKLKDQREQFFKDHFDEMADIARHPDTPQAEIDTFMDRDKNYLQIMAVSHYKQLWDHPENPYYKQVLEKIQKEDAERKAEAERVKQQELDRQQQEMQERFERTRQLYDNNKSMTQKHSHRR